MDNDILVVGSMNMDLIVQTNRYPQQGETIFGNDFKLVPGGKGANQALAIGKLGGSVSFIGACGNDYFGDMLLASLKEGKVNVDNVCKVKEHTGIASITVEKNGDNRIIVAQGANSKLTPEIIDAMEKKISRAKIILLQLEIPLETVVRTINIAYSYQTKVILDPAPAQRLPEDIFRKIDYLLPNEGELDLLMRDHCFLHSNEKIDKLLSCGVGTVLVTKGDKGVSLYAKDKQATYQATKVDAVDTTAAGDAFAGAFAYGLQRRWDEDKAIKFANFAAALAVTKLGAQSSLPSREEVIGFIRGRNINEMDY